MYYSKLYNIQHHAQMAVSINAQSDKQIDFYNIKARKTTQSTTNHNSSKTRRAIGKYTDKNTKDYDRNVSKNYQGHFPTRSSDAQAPSIHSGRVGLNRRNCWAAVRDNKGDSEERGVRSLERDVIYINNRLM